MLVEKMRDMSYGDVYDHYIVDNTNRNNIIKRIVNDIRQKNTEGSHTYSYQIT